MDLQREEEITRLHSHLPKVDMVGQEVEVRRLIRRKIIL